MSTIDTQYTVKVGSLDFSDIIAMENGYQWTIIAESAESATGQLTTGHFRIPKLGYRDWETDRKSTRLNSSHSGESRMPSSA